ncbi:mucin-5AC [Bombus vosnesenskii]|uniref:Mucin-5AC n=1 Tax=Bombus vosnesenskii TaxID=207650 RepID=A0A6J3KXM3_9HYME|nr:mucin-5AC [Bombus vosnesenskii]XP_033356544.1 mucin-5AC [Bombus vosnesenskii]XP_033356545.1 mucin-5AC [Bombus vosnesenskii]
MATEVTESQPFKNLKELFDNVGNLKPWPEIKELRDSTDYMYSGLEISAEKMQLEKLDREVQPRTLLCHDMKGGYLEDRFINGSESYGSYLFYHWSVIDTFVYFSHHFITVPPFGWINVAHNHGVKVLGTVITEREGIWDVILESQEEVRRFADALILVAKFYKFDGWLLNVENTIKSEQVNNLIYFVKYLTENIHEAIRNSEIIWYDSVTNEGKLNWQNELNSKNIDFFLNCDGIYLNYNWTKSKLENSVTLAKNHNRDIHDIYVGLDIWGRGCPGGGGFNSTYALQKIRHEGLSVAIFGPGWTHEFFGSQTFQEIEDLFWAQLFPYLYVHVPIYEDEVFKTSFCRGSGSLYYCCGQPLYEQEGRNFIYKSFYNLSLQNPQISVPIPHMKFTSSPQLPEPKSENDRNECSKGPIQYVYETRKNVIRVLENVVNIENKMPMLHVNSFEFCNQFSFEGGGCIKLITNDLTATSYHRLFLVHIEFQQDIVAIIAYKEMESSIANGSQHKPILVLGNNTGIKSIFHYKSRDLVSNWKKCVYLTNMRTVNEIGISFARSNVCYLGEVILKQKQRHLNADSTAQIATRIQLSLPNITWNKSVAANIANVELDVDRAGQEETDATISENNFICDTLEGGNETNKTNIAENKVLSIDVKQDSENLKKDSTPEFPATETSSTVPKPPSATSFISNALEVLTLPDNKYAKTVQTVDPVSHTCQEECIDERNNLELAIPKSSILSNKQYAFGNTSTSQFLTSPASESKESVCDNAESRSTAFCWNPITTTLSSPTSQVPTALQTLHNPTTARSSILAPTTFNLSNTQYAFGNTSTSQFLTSPTSESKESVCDNAESRSTAFYWNPIRTTLSSPTSQVPTALQTLHNPTTPRSSILAPTTSNLSNTQYAFGNTSTSQFLTSPTSKSKESVCDNAESRSTAFYWNPIRTTLSSPTSQVPTALQTLHNPTTPRSSILAPTTSNLSNTQYAFGNTSTSQFLTSPTSESKESVCDNAESRSTAFYWNPIRTTLSSPTSQVPTALQTLHNPTTPRSSILAPTTSNLSNTQHAFGNTSTSQFLTSPTSKSKESVCDNAESRSTAFYWNPIRTTLSSPTSQVPTALQTLHNPTTPRSSILTPTTFNLSNELCGEISCKRSTSAVLENKPTFYDSTIRNQQETTCNTTLGMPTAMSTSFVTLSATSMVPGDTTYTMPTSESTRVVHVHQTFLLNGIPTEPVVMPPFNFSANVIPTVSTQNQASIGFSGNTFNASYPVPAAFPRYTTASSFSTSQPVTYSRQLSTSSSMPLIRPFNFASPLGDCTAGPASIQSRGFNFNPPNTKPSFYFNVHKFNAPIQVRQGTASTQVRRKCKKQNRRLK